MALPSERRTFVGVVTTVVDSIVGVVKRDTVTIHTLEFGSYVTDDWMRRQKGDT